jgi:cation transport regulator
LIITHIFILLRFNFSLPVYRVEVDARESKIEVRRTIIMPYSAISDLPDNVRNVLPAHAQEIFKEAFNSAYDQYKDPEERRGNTGREDVARRVAWSAVKKSYKKGEDDKWHPKK